MTGYTPEQIEANRNKLLEWLDSGAPEMVFDLNFPVRIIDEWLEDRGHDLNELGQPDKDITGCGSACCIAGAAQLMELAPRGEMFPSVAIQNFASRCEWEETRDAALPWLDLPRICTHMGHHLFDPDEARDFLGREPTPQEAARAARIAFTDQFANPWEVLVQREIDGEEV